MAHDSDASEKDTPAPARRIVLDAPALQAAPSPRPQLPRQAPPRTTPAGAKVRKKAEAHWLSPAEGLAVHGELTSVVERMMRDYKAEWLEIKDLDRPDDLVFYLPCSWLALQALHEAKRIGWPNKRVYIHIAFNEKGPISPLRPELVAWKGVAEVALLLAYDVKVAKLDDLRHATDGARVLVQETGAIYRVDKKGSNR